MTICVLLAYLSSQTSDLSTTITADQIVACCTELVTDFPLNSVVHDRVQVRFRECDNGAIHCSSLVDLPLRKMRECVGHSSCETIGAVEMDLESREPFECNIHAPGAKLFGAP